MHNKRTSAAALAAAMALAGFAGSSQPTIRYEGGGYQPQRPHGAGKARKASKQRKKIATASRRRNQQ